MAAATVPTKTPAVRRDPRPRPTDGVAGWFRIKGETKDPNKFYVWVDIANGEVDHYASMGYKAVKWAGPQQGPQIVGGQLARNPGDDITCRGQLLMQIDFAEKMRLEEEGEFGDSGQKDLSRIEQLIIKKRGATDYFRGISNINGRLDNGQFMEVENETSAAYGVQVL